MSRLGFGLGAVGIILMAGAWFSYLHLDGLTPIDTAKKKFGVKNKKKKTKQSMGGDIADYLDEEIVPYEELDESEKAACQMAACLTETFWSSTAQRSLSTAILWWPACGENLP